MSAANKVNNYVKANEKSEFAGFLLTFFFGPLGLFYCNWISALILTLVAIASATSIIGPIICWIIAMIINFPYVNKYNSKVRATAELMGG